MYYLQSRYYDPKIGRFINADAFASTGQGLIGNNMFAYCNNNPVNLLDSTGNWPTWVENLWDDLKDFFDKETGSSSATFGNGNSTVYASVTAGYSEFYLGGMGQNQALDRRRDRYETTGYIGVNGSASIIHACVGGESWQNNSMGLIGAADIDVFFVDGLRRLSIQKRAWYRCGVICFNIVW